MLDGFPLEKSPAPIAERFQCRNGLFLPLQKEDFRPQKADCALDADREQAIYWRAFTYLCCRCFETLFWPCLLRRSPSVMRPRHAVAQRYGIPRRISTIRTNHNARPSTTSPTGMGDNVLLEHHRSKSPSENSAPTSTRAANWWVCPSFPRVAKLLWHDLRQFPHYPEGQGSCLLALRGLCRCRRQHH